MSIDTFIDVIRRSLGRRLVNLLPVAQRTSKASTLYHFFFCVFFGLRIRVVVMLSCFRGDGRCVCGGCVAGFLPKRSRLLDAPVASLGLLAVIV